ncbi:MULTISPECIES: alpha/beta fold hydrolase [Azospirillum]|uniref:Alpha/beta fold hydrolase n=2 Tax=Azospirillum brasilense TaxID=192 RepID=A0A4D8QNH8_AZOBR|nr:MULTISPECIES: alpha/beta fold hydrolase [Azospirillum]MDW7557774.1 alpha/beta fold hydrolase [Azospirillum brasilense]MDW7597389.1 alpha/beta fold hydrolase [Azospirillum brasilense]MDW7632615.1 alpha/beta fold hydrolase [Azospirillum brasilense]MDX5950819.1 alpha/beta fold hydrolase [Azospirillum brasilense]QCO11054.1 alpha/beta fold hydrolase [Azospirillum brasilense]
MDAERIRTGERRVATGMLTELTAGAPSAERPTLVLLHGIQGSASAWKPLMERLSPEIHALAPNLRGRAGSHAPDLLEAYGLDGFAADVAAYTAGIAGPFVLAGWSMGVLVSLEYVARHGCGRLAGLVLVGGTAHPGTECRWFAGETPERIAEEAARRAEALRLTETAAPFAVAGSWMAARRADHRGTLAAVSVPTLVVHGAADDQCPLSHGRAIADAIAGAELEVWEGCGHNPMAHDPQRLADALAAFMARL